MTFTITRTEVIGEVETSPAGKFNPASAALRSIADHVNKTDDTTGAYSVDFGGVMLSVELHTPRPDSEPM